MPLSLLPLLLAACAGDKPADDSGASVTYYTDAKPIFDAYCTTCHYDGGIAPFSLTSYESAAPWAHTAAARAAAHEMPPWKPDDACNSYQYDFSLPDEHIATLSAWDEAGAPEGDPAQEGAALTLDRGLMSRVDVELPMAESYTMSEEPDEYRCFVFPWEEGDTYITGFQVTPGEPRVVHHVIAYSVDAAGLLEAEALDTAEAGYGYTCYGGPGVSLAAGGADWVGAWVPGSSGRDNPEGTGIPMSLGGGIVVQVHYNSDTAGPLPDLTTVAFKIDDSVEKEASVRKVFDPAWITGTDPLDIPAGEADASASVTYTIPTDVTVYSVGLHMHQLGSYGKLWNTDESGAETCLLDIDDWDFHWQGSYLFETPVHLVRGDEVTLECHWDNSRGTEDITWGEGSSDEMCLGIAYLTVD